MKSVQKFNKFPKSKSETAGAETLRAECSDARHDDDVAAPHGEQPYHDGDVGGGGGGGNHGEHRYTI